MLMNVLMDYSSRFAPSGSIAYLMTDRWNGRICFDAPNDGGAGETAAALAAAELARGQEAITAALALKATNDAAKAAADKIVADKAITDAAAAAEALKNGVSPEVAALLKETMKRKADNAELVAKLKAFEGIDPAAIKELMAANDATKLAAKEAADKLLADAGKFDLLKTSMAEQHAKDLKVIQDKLDLAEATRTKSDTTIGDLTIGQSFNNSAFVKDELILTPAKARTVYGTHFETENGKVVAYDKPRGEANRAPLVDASGNAVDFDAAMKRLIDADPEKDSMLRSKLLVGTGGKPNVPGKAADPSVPRGVAGITFALASRFNAGKK
jgi:hypothetical protein